MLLICNVYTLPVCYYGGGYSGKQWPIFICTSICRVHYINKYNINEFINKIYKFINTVVFLKENLYKNIRGFAENIKINKGKKKLGRYLIGRHKDKGFLRPFIKML